MPAHHTATLSTPAPTLLASLLDNSPHGVIAYEAIRNEAGSIIDYRTIYYNPKVLVITGHTHEEMTMKWLFERAPYAREQAEDLRRVVEEQITFDIKQYIPPLNKWFSFENRPLPEGFFTTLQDISEIYSATRQINEQAQLFQGVLDNITNGLSILKSVRDDRGDLVDCQYITVSQTVLADTCLKADQLIGQSMLTLFPGVKQTPHWQALSAAFITGEPQHFEVKYSYDGYDNYMDSWITRLDEDRLISVYSIINEQKQAESLAKQRTAILQSVLDGSQTAICLFEAIRNDGGQIIDFRYLIQNEANARLVGHSLADTQTKTMLEVLPKLKESGIFDRYVAVTETGQPQQFKQKFTDGTVDGWFNICIVKQDDGIVVSANDLTLLHQTLQRTEQLVIELQNSNHNLEQFAYIASHDLQEPLRKIQSFGNLIIDQYGNNLPEDGRMMLYRMQSAAERMSQLIRDLLAYSRLTGTQERFVHVSLPKLFTDIQTDLELIIREKKALIQIDLANEFPLLNGNELQLRQLFQNLLSNALKFIQPGTIPRISIKARATLADNVPASVPNRTDHAWLAIDVADNGIGFDQKYGEQIFQLFERLHGRSEYTGTGIGLAICRKVAENHGGTITAQGRIKKGATFTVYLPL